jgi:hypothetical protein
LFLLTNILKWRSEEVQVFIAKFRNEVNNHSNDAYYQMWAISGAWPAKCANSVSTQWHHVGQETFTGCEWFLTRIPRKLPNAVLDGPQSSQGLGPELTGRSLGPSWLTPSGDPVKQALLNICSCSMTSRQLDECIARYSIGPMSIARTRRVIQ